MIGENLLRYKYNQKFIVADVETEGLNLATTRAWQLSYAICNYKEIESINIRHLNWPNLLVSNEAAFVTRFNMHHHLSIAEDPKDVLLDFEKILYDPQYIIVGHNWLGFDCFVLNSMRKRIGLKSDWSYLSRVIDTHALSKAFQKGWVPDKENLLSWQYKMINYREQGLKSSLGYMAKKFEIDYDEKQAHDAKYDTIINFNVLKKLIKEVEI